MRGRIGGCSRLARSAGHDASDGCRPPTHDDVSGDGRAVFLDIGQYMRSLLYKYSHSLRCSLCTGGHVRGCSRLAGSAAGVASGGRAGGQDQFDWREDRVASVHISEEMYSLKYKTYCGSIVLSFLWQVKGIQSVNVDGCWKYESEDGACKNRRKAPSEYFLHA